MLHKLGLRDAPCERLLTPSQTVRVQLASWAKQDHHRHGNLPLHPSKPSAPFQSPFIIIDFIVLQSVAKYDLIFD